MSTFLLTFIFVYLFFVNFRVLAILTTKNVGYSKSSRFDDNYVITWGDNHVSFLDQGNTVQLLMDNSSGAGFGSKLLYNSGFFQLRIKLPNKDSAGVVTAFYLTSHGKNHDEIDFEFLGNVEGKPIDLQTNIFANGVGNREQKTHLWFDPSADFHSYKILWNTHQIVFYVDTIAIRVYKNNKELIGENYPRRPMRIKVSLWDGEDWATDGGRTKTNWSHSPFKAYFRSFNIYGCPTSTAKTNPQACYSTNLWWNRQKFWELGPAQKRMYEVVRKKYMTYDYCNVTQGNHAPPECLQS